MELLKRANGTEKRTNMSTNRDEAKVRILEILSSTSDSFNENLHDITFVGSIVDWLNGKKEFSKVGDIDLLITGRGMAEKFWILLDELMGKGLRSVYNVSQLPGTMKNWNPCNPGLKWHPIALTLECAKNQEKVYNLDVNVDKELLRYVPQSESWMHDATIRFASRPSTKKEGTPDPITFELAIPKVREFLNSYQHPKGDTSK